MLTYCRIVYNKTKNFVNLFNIVTATKNYTLPSIRSKRGVNLPSPLISLLLPTSQGERIMLPWKHHFIVHIHIPLRWSGCESGTSWLWTLHSAGVQDIVAYVDVMRLEEFRSSGATCL